MTRRQAIAARERLLKRLPPMSEVLRGSLIERLTRHSGGCPKCARGEGHRQTVLTISYAGGRTRQFSIPSGQVAQVRRWLGNYQKLKAKIEAVCELNHILLRPEGAPRKTRSGADD
ncbi:MAG: hypothetical protein JO121_13715 [Deltaproteobacteria bacterium]|nr:hypothetical protein [Deltaproteobacteria bacterium]